MSTHPLFSVDPVSCLPGPVPKNRLDKTRGGGQQPSITPRSYSRGPHPRYLLHIWQCSGRLIPLGPFHRPRSPDRSSSVLPPFANCSIAIDGDAVQHFCWRKGQLHAASASGLGFSSVAMDLRLITIVNSAILSQIY